MLGDMAVVWVDRWEESEKLWVRLDGLGAVRSSQVLNKEDYRMIAYYQSYHYSFHSFQILMKALL